MLVSLHIKNFAIIHEVEVNFRDHLNIMTGETGAGKSIIIGSVNAALGAKVGKDILRHGADYALVELVFETTDENVIRVMKEQDLPIEDGQIIVSRKIMPTRSITKINGETVTSTVLSQIAELLIDIHGQHEHQSLLHKSKHLEIVDHFSKAEIGSLKQELSQCYREYCQLKQEFDQSGIDEEKRVREISFLEYEVNEIKNAALTLGEDEVLSIKYKKLANANAISEGLKNVYHLTGYEAASAGDLIGRAIRQLHKIAEFDESIAEFLNQVTDVETQLNELNRNLAQYISDMDNPQEELEETARRLDLLNHLKSKYGNSLEQILAYCTECELKIERYNDYDAFRNKLYLTLQKEEDKLQTLSLALSEIRKRKAAELTGMIREALIALNFLDVMFDMSFQVSESYSANGFDDAEFMISTNPGEKLKPLSKIASGGELSRIMLGIKSVLADKDEIDTLIFDEIDVGISGRTAQKVSEQLAVIANHHQIICITHLAQIAAMADAHFMIEKSTDGNSTQTNIKELTEKESIDELSRILSGAEITERVRENAKEMKHLAGTLKNF